MKSPIAAVVSAIMLSGTSTAQVNQFDAYTPEITEFIEHRKPMSPASQPNPTFIVTLESAPLARQFGRGDNTKGNNLLSQQHLPAFEIHKEAIAKAQQALIHQLQQKLPGSKVLSRFDTVLNGMTVSAPGLTAEQLSDLPGVQNVYPQHLRYAQMDASLELIGADAIWALAGGRASAGEGVRVAVIDGGIRPENPMFSGQGFSAPSSLPNDDYCSTTDASFCNNKLIVARWSQPGFTVCEQEHLSPLDYNGHGTHVSGSAVGNQVSQQLSGINLDISGVAPGAYLMVYKALFSDTDCAGGVGTDSMLLEALEHAVEDGADIINNSWGGAPGEDPNNSVYQSVFESAQAAGVVVVSAAGNDGNTAKTVSCPACIEAGLAVANSTTGRFFANSLTAGGNSYLAINSNSPAPFNADIQANIIAAANIDSNNSEACDSFAANSFSGAIALISRGTCTFTQKAENARVAGAIAMVTYNNLAGAPISMFMPEATIPGVMISRENGNRLITQSQQPLQASINVEVDRIQDNEFADIINESSSRGPNGAASVLKPDIAAPGTDILSALSPDTNNGSEFGIISGTSMASPHVAGAAAVLRQLHPDWSAIDIKTALMSSAKSNGIKDDDAETQATPFVMGAGRLDLTAASRANITFSQGSLINPACVGECSFMITAFNKSTQTTNWHTTVSSQSLGIQVTPTNLSIPANGSAELTVSVNTGLSGYEDWLFGEVQINSGGVTAQLPVAVLPQPSSDPGVISISSSTETPTSSDSIALLAQVVNRNFENSISFEALVPDDMQLTSESDVTFSVNNGLAQNTQVTPQKVVWTGTLDVPGITTQRMSSSAQPSIVATGASPVSCAGSCDEVSFGFTVPSFQYHGESYTSITVSDNGLLLVGDGSTANTFENKELPDTNSPDNILAPLWSDYDLAGTNVNDTGGGQLAVTTITQGDDEYIVAEWYQAQLWNDASGNTFTFAVWIKTGEQEEIFFNYPNVDTMPTNVTIGAENASGDLGVSYRFNNMGADISSGDTLLLSSKTGGQVSIGYSVSPTVVTPTSTDQVSLSEDSSAEFNVLNNDRQQNRLAITSVTDGTVTAKAQSLIPVLPAGAITAMLASPPQNGTVTLSDNGDATYTPNNNFFGSDSFTYRVSDDAQLPSNPTLVTLEVINVNDRPVVQNQQQSATTGSQVRLTPNGTDLDNDALTYTWNQTAGTNVTTSVDQGVLSFTAPSAGTLTFSLIASDGIENSAPATYTVEITGTSQPQPEPGNDSGGGSMGWWLLVLTGLMRLRYKNS